MNPLSQHHSLQTQTGPVSLNFPQPKFDYNESIKNKLNDAHDPELIQHEEAQF